jgi:ATP/maltotriose-dependent transcriptional regulator MalT
MAMTVLTERDIAILCRICLAGRCPQEVAHDLDLAPKTVRNHLTSIYRTLERLGAIPRRRDKKTVACVWLWRVAQAAKGNV